MILTIFYRTFVKVQPNVRCIPTLYPELKNIEQMWFQQYGATCHTAKDMLDLLKNKFSDWVISINFVVQASE